jgi:hypothetical protein
MGARGHLVKFTSITATTAKERAQLKKDIGAIIDAASGAITVQAMVEAFPPDVIAEMLDTIRDMEKKK